MVSTIVQLGGVLVLAGLFVLLRRFVLRRRAYFVSWTWGWLALSGALAAVVLRFNVLPLWDAGINEVDLRARFVYFLYQIAKLAAFAMFVDGTRVYTTGARGFGRSGRTWSLVAIYATASALFSSGQGQMIVWQTPVAVATFGVCAWWLLSMPSVRRTGGSLATGSAFLFLAALWAVYALVFGIAAFGNGPAPALVQLVIDANPYLDLLGNIGLGYGMIVVLMEDAKREVDDAQTALRVAHDQLRRAALYDPLTGVMNRSAFTEGLGLDMARASFGTVVLLDLDNLKEVNDEYGHAGGDLLLRATADALRGALRQTDRLYRWGGDEFLLLLPSARAIDVQDRIERTIAAAAPISPGGGVATVQLEASVGAADYASYDDLRSAIDRADTAMYRQKHERKRRLAASGSPVPQTPPVSTPAAR